MKILVVSMYGESAYSWLRLVGEGNELRVYIKDSHYRHEILEGLVDKVEDYRPFVSWCDFCIMDQNNLVKEWEFISKFKPVFGGSEFGHMLEKDRKFGREIFQYIGLKPLESNTFKTVDEAQEHIRKHKVRHVCKPFGGDEIGSDDIIISEDEHGEDALVLLQRFKDKKIPFKGIDVEERKIGVECALSAWCAGEKGFIGPIEANFEHKRSHAGVPEGQGFLTGETGTAMKYTDRDNVFFSKTLSKIERVIKDVDYRGQLDMSFIADKEGFWPLEFTPRLGYPALSLNISLQKTELTKLFHGLATATLKDNEVSTDWCIGVVVMSFGFPFPDMVKKHSANSPLFNLTEDNADHVFLYEIKGGKHDKEPGLVTSNGIGVSLVVCDTAPTLPEAQKKTYKYLNLSDPDRIRIPNSFFRNDIGDRVVKQRSDIIKYGILTEAEYGPV